MFRIQIPVFQREVVGVIQVNRMVRILALNIAGQPHRWLSPEQAITAKVRGKIVYGWGDEDLVFHGGLSRAGIRSSIRVEPIVVLTGSELAKYASDILPLTNPYLFRRDRHTCAYCGGVFGKRELTRDHVVPRVQGGPDTWTNVLTACAPCNLRKGGRRPEEAGMLPLFVPYAPVLAEGFILAGRQILASQMDFLKARLPRHSRIG